LHSRTGCEDTTLEGIGQAPIESPGNGAEQTVRRSHRLVTAVHEHKGARAIRVLDRPGGETGLPKEGSLLIPDHPAAGNAHPVKMLCCCGTEDSTGITHLGKEAGRNIQPVQNLRITATRMDSVQPTPGRVP